MCGIHCPSLSRGVQYFKSDPLFVVFITESDKNQATHCNLASYPDKQTRRAKIRSVTRELPCERLAASPCEVRFLKRLGITGENTTRLTLIPISHVPEVLASFGLETLAQIVKVRVADFLNVQKSLSKGISLKIVADPGPELLSPQAADTNNNNNNNKLPYNPHAAPGVPNGVPNAKAAQELQDTLESLSDL